MGFEVEVNNLNSDTASYRNQLHGLLFLLIVIFSSMVVGGLCVYIAFLKYACLLRDTFTEKKILTHTISQTSPEESLESSVKAV